MLVVKIFKDNAGRFANLTSAVNFESCKRRLKLYFSNLEKVRERILSGEIISVPFVSFRKDRRVKNEKVKNERRKNKL